MTFGSRGVLVELSVLQGKGMVWSGKNAGRLHNVESLSGRGRGQSQQDVDWTPIMI